jgi:hypothetical protein
MIDILSKYEGGGALYCLNCNDLAIRNSKFTHLSINNGNGAAIYVTSERNQNENKTKVIMVGNTLEEC